MQYAIRSKGDFDYQFANDLTWAGGPGAFLALKDKYTVTLQAIVSGEYKGRDNFGGEIAEDTGVTAVYLGPQINFTWGEKLSAYPGFVVSLVHSTRIAGLPMPIGSFGKKMEASSA